MQNKKDELDSLKLPVFMGLDEQNEEVYADLAKIPHLLVIGDTGTGKTMWLTNAILTLIRKYSSDMLKLSLIDCGYVDYFGFEKLKHLMGPSGTDATGAIERLKALDNEITERYRRMSQLGVRNIEEYNQKSEEKLPYIVCVIDEIAELMVNYQKETEEFLERITHMGRAPGIHLMAGTREVMPEVMSPKVRLYLKSFIAYGIREPRYDIDYMRAYLDGVEPKYLNKLGDHIYKNEFEAPIKLGGRFISDEDIAAEVEKIN